MKKQKEVILQPYKTGPFSLWPTWVKVALTKAWVGGAAFYFIGFGMPQLGQGVIDQIFTLGLILGAVNALVIYPFIKFLSKPVELYERYIFVKNESALRIVLQVFYNWLIVIIVAYTYQLINSVINAVMHYERGVIKFGVEPILFGLFYLLVDFLLIKAKQKLSRK